MAGAVIKLTRLNQSTVAINPDHISWVEASPDTTICLISGDKLLVREGMDELIARVVEYRRMLRADDLSRPNVDDPAIVDDDSPSASLLLARRSDSGRPGSMRPGSHRPPPSRSGALLPRRGQ